MNKRPTPAGLAWETIATNALPRGLGPYFERSRALQEIVPEPMPAAWEDPEDRQASLESHLRESIAWQVRINREERGWTQRELSELIGSGQSAVSKLEDPDGGDVRLSTLIKVAHGFDCALLVRLVPFSEFSAAVSSPSGERLFACSYASEVTPLVRSCSQRSQRMVTDDGGL